MSDSFESLQGVKQGDPLSPLMFIFFINDLSHEIEPMSNDDVFVNNTLKLFSLMYADDAVLFSKTKQGLQCMLDKLSIYCKTWNLKVNTNKTKVMIFERGRKTYADFYFNGKKLDLVESFKYLGLTLYKNSGWFRTQKNLSQYGLHALHKLFCLFQNINVSVPEKCKLFDCLVASVLNYGCEIWGNNHEKDIETVHTKLCRHVLGVKKSTNLCSMYGDLGRYPLCTYRKIRMLNYWIKLIENKNSLMYKVYSMLCNDLNNGKTYNGHN